MLFGPGPTLCGHRGSGRGTVGGLRENTLESFRAAVDCGLTWVEADARFTADDVLVSRHDPVAEDGRFISEMTANETDAVGLMRVADLLDGLAEDVGIDVDIKTSAEDALRPRERTTAALVADLVAGQKRPLLLSSFDPSALAFVRERRTEVAVGLLTCKNFPLRKAIPAAVHLGVEVVAAHYGSFPLAGSDRARVERPLARTVEIAHAAGLEVMAWCPPPAEAAELAAAGVDCLVVDRCGRP